MKVKLALKLTLASIAVLMAASALAENTILIDYRVIYRKSSPGVVFIAAVDEKNQGASGTGSIVTADGIVLTNHHVIWDDEKNRVAPTLWIFLKPAKVTGKNNEDLKQSYKAKVLFYDEKMDLAAIQMINPPANLTVIPFADSEEVEPGTASAAIGHPEQGVRWTLTTGQISGQIKDFNNVKGKDVFQMETSINRGNSGGPLLDRLGNIIGVNTMIARVGAGGVAITSVNFAIQGNVAKKWLEANGVKIVSKTYTDDANQSVAAGGGQQTTQQAQNTQQPQGNQQASKTGGDGGTSVAMEKITVPDEQVESTKVSKKEKMDAPTTGDKSKCECKCDCDKTKTQTVTPPKKENKNKPKVVSKEPSGKTFTEDDFAKIEKEMEDMAKDMEDEFKVKKDKMKKSLDKDKKKK